MRLVRRVVAILLLAIVALAALLIALLVLWRYQPPVSTLMLARYATGRPVVREWTPIARLAPVLQNSVVMSEDAQFCRHNGVDWKALNDVIESADEDEGPSRGASTIVMQTAKNLFLWPGRSVLRKALEIPLALLIDAFWPKRRILEVYLNIAEWGPDGVFGAQAAARRAFARDAADLSAREAAILTATLPNPIRRDARKPSRGVLAIAGTIAARARSAGPWTDCLR